MGYLREYARADHRRKDLWNGTTKAKYQTGIHEIQRAKYVFGIALLCGLWKSSYDSASSAQQKKRTILPALPIARRKRGPQSSDFGIRPRTGCTMRFTLGLRIRYFARKGVCGRIPVGIEKRNGKVSGESESWVETAKRQTRRKRQDYP